MEADDVAARLTKYEVLWRVEWRTPSASESSVNSGAVAIEANDPVQKVKIRFILNVQVALPSSSG